MGGCRRDLYREFFEKDDTMVEEDWETFVWFVEPDEVEDWIEEEKPCPE